MRPMRPGFRAVSAAFLGALLAGCATTQAPRIEDMPSPLEFRYAATGTSPAARPAPEPEPLPATVPPARPAVEASRTPWWTGFSDPELDRLMKRVTSGNPDYIVALKRLDEARLQVQLTRKQVLPSLEYGFIADRSKFAGAGSGFNSGRTRNSFELPLQLRYEPDIWGRIRRAVEAGQADAEAAAADSGMVLLLLQTEVASRYFEWLALHTEEAVLERAVAVREKALSLTQARFEAGDVSEIDVALAKTELYQVRTEQQGLDRRRVEVANAIAAGVGSYPTDFDLAASRLPDGGPVLKSGLNSDLLRRRPDVRAAGKRLEARLARLGAARTLRFPSVKLSAAAGFESETFDDLGRSDSRTWSAGLALSGPLFDAGTVKNLVAIADTRVQEAEAAYRGVLIEAFRQTETALGVIAALDRQLAGYRDTVQSARNTVALTEKQYRAGLVDYFEVVNAQRTLLTNEQAAARALAERYQVLVQLVRALGGSWSP